MKKNKSLCQRKYSLPQEVQDQHYRFVESNDRTAAVIGELRRSRGTDDFHSKRDRVLAAFSETISIARDLEKYFTGRSQYWENKQAKLSHEMDSYRNSPEIPGNPQE